MAYGVEDGERELGEDEASDVVAGVKKRWKEAREHWRDWREEAAESYRLVAGQQWTDEEKSFLESQKRPPITFNRIAPTIDAICGSEAQNRQAIRYMPRELGDAGANELLTNAAAWVRDRSNADVEENDAFRDCLITGLGCTETRVSYDQNADGEIEIDRVDPFEVYPDPMCTRRNLTDARYVIRERWVAYQDVKAQWPEVAAELPTELDDALEPSGSPVDATDQDYETDSETHYRANTREYRLVECQWREYTVYYRVLDPQTGKLVDLTEKKFQAINELAAANGFPPPRSVKAKRWEWQRAVICGDHLLENGPAPCPTQPSYLFMTGLRDRERRIHYGLVRAMADPQRWANKFLSQTMHIINSNAKGGVMYESGAFVDPQAAKEAWAQPDAFVPLAAGGLGRVQQRAPIQYPAGLDNLIQLSMSSIRDVTGVNLEMLGLADRVQPGVVESQRKQAALTILANWFDGLRAYRRQHGKVLLDFIRRYISDGRLIKIDSENGARFAPLIRQPETAEFDVIVDSAPTAVNVKQETFEALQKLLPALLQAGIPIPPEVLRYAPLPESLAAKWMEHIKSGGIPPQVKQMIEIGKAQIGQLTQELGKRDQAMQKMEADLVKTQIQLQMAKADASTAEQKNAVAAAEQQVKQFLAQIEAFRAQTERLQAELDAQKVANEREQLVLTGVVDTRREQEREQEQQQLPAVIDERVIAALSAKMEELRATIRADVEAIVNAPKQLQYDSAGRVASINGRPVVRGPDGRILGIQ